MSNEEIVMQRMSGKAKTPIHLENDEHIVIKMTAFPRVEDNIVELLSGCLQFKSYTSMGRIQCRERANRSPQDLWRLYKYYFDPNIEFFSILRALYLLVDKRRISGNYCFVVRKFVFYSSSYGSFYDRNLIGDVGVPFDFWENIGERNDC
jgi:hypothetical protein